jgi:hypothetical protein
MCFDGIAAACHSLRFSVATKRSSLTILLTPPLFFLAFAAICCLLRQRLAQVQLSHRVLPIAARKDKRRWPDSVKHVRSGAPMASCCERAASRSGAAASGNGRRPPCESIDRHRLHGWACRSWQRQAVGASTQCRVAGLDLIALRHLCARKSGTIALTSYHSQVSEISAARDVAIAT